eukprot:gene17736-21129_t
MTAIVKTQALKDTVVLLELMNDTTIKGQVLSVDEGMNVMLKDASYRTLQGAPLELPMVFVKGSNLRYIHVSRNLNAGQLVEDHRAKLDTAANMYSNSRASGMSTPGNADTKKTPMKSPY